MSDPPERDSYSGVCNRVITEVAATVDEPPERLDQALFDVVDPDALEKLFADRDGPDDRPIGRVQFTFSGCSVVVRSSGEVSVSRSEDVPNRHSEISDERANRSVDHDC